RATPVQLASTSPAVTSRASRAHLAHRRGRRLRETDLPFTCSVLLVALKRAGRLSARSEVVPPKGQCFSVSYSRWQGVLVRQRVLRRVLGPPEPAIDGDVPEVPVVVAHEAIGWIREERGLAGLASRNESRNHRGSVEVGNLLGRFRVGDVKDP